MRECLYFVYILSNRPNGAIYIGVTNSLRRRIFEHKAGVFDGYTKEHGINQLVYYEVYKDVSKALFREKELKKWKREWKNKLIEDNNPDWDDLYHLLMR